MCTLALLFRIRPLVADTFRYDRRAWTQSGLEPTSSRPPDSIYNVNVHGMEVGIVSGGGSLL